jgi:hypothetical protein
MQEDSNDLTNSDKEEPFIIRKIISEKRKNKKKLSINLKLKE